MGVVMISTRYKTITACCCCSTLYLVASCMLLSFVWLKYHITITTFMYGACVVPKLKKKKTIASFVRRQWLLLVVHEAIINFVNERKRIEKSVRSSVLV